MLSIYYGALTEPSLSLSFSQGSSIQGHSITNLRGNLAYNQPGRAKTELKRTT